MTFGRDAIWRNGWRRTALEVLHVNHAPLSFLGTGEDEALPVGQEIYSSNPDERVGR